MTVTQVVGGLGSWELRLTDETRQDVLDQIDYFGHIVIVPGQVDVEATGQALLKAARYVGVLRAKAKGDARQMAGSGMLFWLGDEDDKGHVFETEVNLVSKTLLEAVTAVKPPSVALGTVYPQTVPSARYTGKHVFQSPRKALDAIAEAFGAEIRVNGDGTLDVGTQAQLYATAPRQDGQATPIITRTSGSDIDLLGVPGDPAVEEGAYDFTTDVVLVGQTTGGGDEPSEQFAVGRKSATSVPYLDIFGNPVKFTRVISESGETVGSVDSRATLQLNRFNRLNRSLALHAGDYEAIGDFIVGDLAYVYDPETGIRDYARELMHQGERIWPDVVRVSGMTWPVTRGHTVAFRTFGGVWLDLTPFVTWETSGTDIVVGDLPKSLVRPSDPLQDRVDAGRGKPSTKTPKTPTGLVLSTSSAPNAKGWDSAVITASWAPVTQYEDNTNVALHHYELQYRPQFRSPAWTANLPTGSLTADLPVTAALTYDVQVRAVSTGGVPSAWSSTASIISAADSTAPATPSDPVVTPYLGILRIYWNGLNNVGGPMPSDFNRVDVHVGTIAGFTPTAATLVSSLSVAGYAHAQAPYGSARFVRFIAYDHNGNPSASSATISGTAVQANDGDIAALSVGKLTAGVMVADVTISGRFATALTGARREMNGIGFQAFDASDALTINLDGINNLLTGKFQTALTGRRIVMGSAGAVGVINFFAPDGTATELGSFTGGVGGSEVIRMGVPTSGVSQFWNKHQIQSDGSTYSWSALNKIVVGGNGPEVNKGFLVAWATGRGTAADANIPDGARIRVDSGSSSLLFGGETRFSVDSGGNVLWFGGQGRLWMDSLGNYNSYPTAGSWSVQERDAAGALFYRLRFTQNLIQVYPGDAVTRGYMEIRPGSLQAGFLNTPDIKFLTPVLSGLVYGSILRHAVNNNGTNSGLEVRNLTDSGFDAIKASGFVVSSSETQKTDVEDYGTGAMSRLRPVKVSRFRRRQPDGVVAPLEIGVIAEDTKTEWVLPGNEHTGPMVSLSSALFEVLAGLQEVDARLTKLETRGQAA